MIDPVPRHEDELLDLLRRLARAQARARSASRGGPEWDAAMAAVQDLEAAIMGQPGRKLVAILA